MPELDLLRRTAALARLKITEEEALSLARDFDAILEHFRILSTLDVDGVEPTLGASSLEDVKRPDTPTRSLPVDSLLAAAPCRREDYFGVPKTVGGQE